MSPLRPFVQNSPLSTPGTSPSESPVRDCSSEPSVRDLREANPARMRRCRHHGWGWEKNRARVKLSCIDTVWSRTVHPHFSHSYHHGILNLSTSISKSIIPMSRSRTNISQTKATLLSVINHAWMVENDRFSWFSMQWHRSWYRPGELLDGFMSSVNHLGVVPIIMLTFPYSVINAMGPLS